MIPIELRAEARMLWHCVGSDGGWIKRDTGLVQSNESSYPAASIAKRASTCNINIAAEATT